VSVSVLVCTYQRSAEVVRCLEALGRVRFTASDLEVVIVDDGSDDPIDSAVAALRLPMATRVIRQPHGGLASARNTGIRAAAGDLLVIIDDDTVADPGLIEEHCRSHRGRDRLVVMGRVRHVSPGRPPGRFPRLADLSMSFFWTANVSVARRHLLDAGLFDEDFREYGWEDLELGDRLRALGLSRRRNWRAVVDHVKLPPGAADVPAMLARAEASGRSAVVYIRKRPTLGARLATGFTMPRRTLSRALGRYESRFSAVISRAPDGPLGGRARVAAEILAGLRYYRAAEQAMAEDVAAPPPDPPV
jgi:glycosyltransferase involved in cell wall biosynthesis